MKQYISRLFQPEKSVRIAAYILMGMVLISRVLGLVRDRLLASIFLPEELGVYFAAFRLPNLLFELLVMGAFTTSFIPVFTNYLVHDKKEDAFAMSSILINSSIIILFSLCIPLFIWTKEISIILTPGFRMEQVDQMVSYTRFMLLFQVVPLLIGNFFIGILQSYKYFFLPAFAPVAYNIGIIIGIVCFASTVHMYAPIIGIGIGAFLFMAVQIPTIYSIGYRYRPVISFHHKGVKEVMKLMIPRTIGLAVSQIDTTVDLILASILGARMVTFFNFAQHLQYLPVGLFGATVAQAVLPSLSQSYIKKDTDGFFRALFTSIQQIVFYLCPISVLFIVLRVPIVRLVFGADRFDWEATILTSKTLMLFSFSLVAQGVVHILARAFYALYNSKTPMIISIVSVLCNAGISYICVQVYGLPIWSLGFSASLASVINAVLLFLFLFLSYRFVPPMSLFVSGGKILFASLIMGIMIYLPLKLFDQLVIDTTRTTGLIFLTAMTGISGLTVFLFLSWVFGIEELVSFRMLIKKIQNRFVILDPVREVITDNPER